MLFVAETLSLSDSFINFQLHLRVASHDDVTESKKSFNYKPIIAEKVIGHNLSTFQSIK